MTTTNQEVAAAAAAAAAASAAPHGLATQQQHELIKLLAQHFHHQFYQLANNSSEEQSSRAAAAAAAAAMTATTAPNSYHRQQSQAREDPAQNRVDPGLLMTSSAPNFNPPPQTVASSRPPHQPMLSASQRALGSAGQLRGLPPDAYMADFNNQNTHPNSHYDLNLYNALGLNLTSNQLVLSLQQQSLLQAAAAAAAVSRHHQLQQSHFEARLCSDLAAAEQQVPPQLLHPQLQRRDLLSLSGEGSIGDGRQINSRQRGGESPTADAKDALKFSISTILGKTSGATRSSFNSNTSKAHVLGDRDSCDTYKERVNGVSLKRVDGDSEDLQHNNISDSGDEFGSESSSLHAPPSPKHNANGSILFSSQSLISNSNNRSATNSTAFPADLHQSMRHQNPQHSLQTHHNHHHPHGLPLLASSTAFPWTVAARGKPRRGMMRRAVFSDSQRVGLEKRFQLQKYISKPDRKKLAEKLGLRDSQVKIWFQNRRMKWRNSKERELLSAGGSREQTLPTRNNPNPDLSDVGETIKRFGTAGSSSSTTAAAASSITNTTNASVDVANQSINKLSQ